MMENETSTGGGGKNVGSIAERRAAKCGFKPTPWLTTARFGSSGVSPLSSPAAVVIRSPFVTIPPGISPTTLLDSPATLFHSQALPSPTAGSFQIPFVEYGTMSDAVENANAGKDNHFMFRNQPVAPSSISTLQSTDINQVFPPLYHKQKQHIESGDNGSICKEECSTKEMQQQHGVVSTASLHSESKQTHRPREYSDGEDDLILQQQLFEEDELAGFTGSVGRRSEARYDWREYGRQKQVECSEFPLSYSMDGEITDVVYKRTHHHHPKPPPHPPTHGPAFLYSNSMGAFTDSTAGAGAGVGPLVSFDEESIGKNFDRGGPGDKINASLKVEGLDWASSASVVTTELSDAPPPSTTAQEYRVIDGDGVAATQQGSTTIGVDGEDDDDDGPESKRRKGESSLIDSSTAASSSVREPRVVVQTISEIDILEDGYRWRKYGQKVVKGNPNPRSYYKCTHPGCPVRKLVERASYDLKSVITTYEGKHNHAVPAGKSQKPAAAAAAAAAAQADRGPEIYGLLRCRARKNAASFHPQTGGFSALAFGSLASSVPFPVSNFDQNLAFRMPTSFLGGDTGFAKYGHYYYQPRASVGEVVEFLHGQHKSFGMLPMEEQGNVDFDSNTG